MLTDKVLCCECRKEVEYTVESKQMTSQLKNKDYVYTGQEARCNECGSLLWIPEIHDSNLRALYDVYRNENGLIPLDVVRKIPQKYDIGKRPLSLLLGWGEQTFTRYYDGDVPSRQYSDMLMRIYDDPKYYSELLEANKGNLKSSLAYSKSRHAVDKLLYLPDDSESKINVVIRYLLNQCEDVTPLALQKALYYIQGFYYAFFNTFVFSEDCQAWAHGPVYRDIYFRYRNYRFDPIDAPETFDASIFTDNEKELYDSIIKNVCCYSGKTLERFTHNEKPWLITRGSLLPEYASTKVIPKEIIGEYFVEVKNKYDMDRPKDIERYTSDMFAHC